MNFQRERGANNIFATKRKASTALEEGQAVMFDAQGFVVPADSSADDASIAGVIMQTVTTADADYAVAGEVSVDKPSEVCEFRAVVGNGTPAQAMVGSVYGLDANGQVDLADTVDTGVEVVRIVDDATVIVRFIV